MKISLQCSLHVALRIALISAFFFLCYHLDTLIDRYLDPSILISEPAPEDRSGWWNALLSRGKTMLMEQGAKVLKTVLYFGSKIVWPFMFAAFAVPFALPRDWSLRNRWSLVLIGILTIVSLFLVSDIWGGLVETWHHLKTFEFAELGKNGYFWVKLKWAMAVVAIDFTLAFTLAYRLLSRIKMEQLLFFGLLALNSVYILLLDPIVGEVDDVMGVVVTAFLSLAVWVDRLLVKEINSDSGEDQRIGPPLRPPIFERAIFVERVQLFSPRNTRRTRKV